MASKFWPLVLILIICVEISVAIPPNKKFQIDPVIYDEDGEIMRRTLESGSHAPKITIEYEVFGKPVSLDLELNYEILPENSGLYHQGSNNELVPFSLNNTRETFCYYRGRIPSIPGSVAAISTCSGIKGAVFDGENLYSINSENGKDHYVTLETQLFLPDKDTNQWTNESLAHPIRKREAQYDVDENSHFVELFLVVDHKVSGQFKHSVSEVHSFVLENVNMLNMAYNQLNIFIALVGLEIWDKSDKFEISDDINELLEDFKVYRHETISPEHPNDNAYLITGHTYGGTLGIAGVGTMCRRDMSCGVASKAGSDLSLARTISHEMGHNFGITHDDEGDCACKEEQCLMAAVNKAWLTLGFSWSSCSVQQIKDFLRQNDVSCLKNKPKSLLNKAFCGNGFIEAGEECDCGLPEFCKNKCCDMKTCKLVENAKCANGECCNKETCDFQEQSHVCRRATSGCDLPEYCPGSSEECPDDSVQVDGEPCENDTGYCYEGKCQNPDDVCRSFWGPHSFSKKKCYKVNKKGIQYGHCGQMETGKFVPCNEEDIYCGLLHCSAASSSLISGKAVSIAATSINSKCSIIYDVKYSMEDPGHPVLVNDGVKCGKGLMCFNQKCVPISELQQSQKICTKDCKNKEKSEELGPSAKGPRKIKSGSVSGFNLDSIYMVLVSLVLARNI